MPADEITYIGIGIYAVEISLLTFGLFSLILLCYLINKTKGFHRNFRDLINVIIVGYGVVIIMRYVIVPFSVMNEFAPIAFWTKYSIFFTQAHDVAIYIYTTAFLYLAIERCIATVFSKTYETHFQSIWTTTFIWTSLTYTMKKTRPSTKSRTHKSQSFHCFCFHCFNNGITLQCLVNAGIFYYFVTAGTNFTRIFLLIIEDIFSATLSFILMHNNRRIFKKALIQGNHRHALSQRYQIAENIKITRLVFPIIILEALAKVVLIFVLFYIFIYPANMNDTRMLSHLFDVTLAFYMASMPWMFILRHQPYRAIVVKYMPKVQMFRNEVVEIRTLQAVNGGEILMEPTQKDYFDILHKEWERTERR